MAHSQRSFTAGGGGGVGEGDMGGRSQAHLTPPVNLQHFSRVQKVVRWLLICVHNAEFLYMYGSTKHNSSKSHAELLYIVW